MADRRRINAGIAELKAFPPIASRTARVLILGSMPSAASIDANRYYAHPRNQFWIIVSMLFDIDAQLDYEERCRKLITNRIALWDVIAGCTRRGSLDADIVEDSIRVNDFTAFFKQHKTIHTVFFNGGKAEQIYQRYVLRTLPADIKLDYAKLPSTSPANASQTFAAKLEAWRIIDRCLH